MNKMYFATVKDVDVGTVVSADGWTDGFVERMTDFIGKDILLITFIEDNEKWFMNQTGDNYAWHISWLENISEVNFDES